MMTREQVEYLAAWISGPSEMMLHDGADSLLRHDAEQRQALEQKDQTIATLTQQLREAQQQAMAWRLAHEGLERQHKALTDQIPSDMIQADPILVERVTTACLAALKAVGVEVEA